MTPTDRLIVVAHGVGGPGGMEHVHAEHVRRLASSFAITVIAADLDPSLLSSVTWLRVRVPRRPIPLKFCSFFVLAGLALRSARQPEDLVQTCGAVVPNRVDVATVHFCHAGAVAQMGLAPKSARLLRRLNTAIQESLALLAERWCYRPSRVGVLHAVSDGVAAELVSHFSPTPVRVVPNGIDPERFRPEPGERDALRSRHRLADGTTLALFVGGDWDRKGCDLALGGLAVARQSGSEVVLWVVGTGDERRLLAHAADLGVGSFVTVVGQVSDPLPYYRAADVLVLPSTYETFSLVAHEAAACGVPIVATSVHGVAELIGRDAAGLIVERTAQSVGRALSCLADEPERRREMGAEARRRAGRFDWDVVASEVEDLLRHGAATSERASA